MKTCNWRRRLPALASVALGASAIVAGALGASFQDRNPQGWAAACERTYGHLEALPQPRISRLELRLDIFPEDGRLLSQGSVVVRNEMPVGVPELHLTAPRRSESIAFRVPGRIVPTDDSFPFRRYRLARPLEPGETLRIRFAFNVARDSDAGFTQLDAADFLPHIGYDPGLEIRNPRARRRHGLRPRSEPPESKASFLDHFHATVGTSAGGTAIAPGTLLRRWHEDGRAYFEYSAPAAAVPTGFTVRYP